MKNLAIFASGSGSNAEALVRYFTNNSNARVKCILTNNAKAYVLERAKVLNIQSFIFTKDKFYDSDSVLKLLLSNNIDFIVLAGFLWLVPTNLIRSYPDRIINIHPALLPKYGGKGMYGMYVHEAVIQNQEKQSGITIHYVNEKYDEGNIIFQAKCEISKDETPETLAEKVHKLEYKHFPIIVEKIISEL
ncbi:MAG: phosphoribosylglycinamide formyltransferase [Bacteroidales bacterium]|nr:phosphoribosylglycinamide formyltransferase [Bacteroidales bacterium]